MVHNFAKPQPISIKFSFLESARKVLSAYEIWGKPEMVDWLFQFVWFIWHKMTLRDCTQQPFLSLTIWLWLWPAQIVHSHMYWEKICLLHSLADTNVHRLEKNALNEISRKSNLNLNTWLKFCDGSFTIVTPINCSMIEWTTALCLI